MTVAGRSTSGNWQEVRVFEYRGMGTEPDRPPCYVCQEPATKLVEFQRHDGMIGEGFFCDAHYAEFRERFLVSAS